MSATINNSILRTPDNVKSSVRVSSNDRYARSTQPADFPSAGVDARYSISYLPGIQEHTIETGKTLAESQMKVVMFACEIERLTTQNYELVKENEVLRTQVDKSQREKDLEIKLAIVLAENEKLNQVIEDLYEVYMSEKGGDSNEGYERRIADLLHDLDDWKNRYANLEGGQSVPEQNTPDLQAALISLQEENKRLQQDIKNSKNPSDSDRLLKEYRDKMLQLLSENESLKDLLKSKIEALENKDSSVRTTELNLKASQTEAKKSAGVNADADLRRKVTEADRIKDHLDVLLRDNQYLNNTVQRQIKEIELLRAGQGSQSGDFTEKIQLLIEDNTRLNALLREKLEETDRLKKQAGDVRNVNTRIEELNIKINSLLDRNNELNILVNDKSNEVEELRRRLGASQGTNEDYVSDLRSKLILVTSENERLNTLLLQKVDELERVRRQVAVVTEPGDLQGKLQLVTVENERLNTLLLEKVEEVERLRKQLGDVEGNRAKAEQVNIQIRTLLAENEKLNLMLLEKLKETEQLRQQLNELGGSKWKIEELNRTVEIYRSDIERLNGLLAGKIQPLSSDAVAEDLRAKLVLLMAETERLNLDINQRNSEIEQLTFRLSKDQSEKLRMYIERLLSDNEKLNQMLLKKLDDIEEIRRRMARLEGSSSTYELQVRLDSLTKELDRLRQLLNDKDSELNILRRRVAELEGGNAGNVDLQRRLNLLSDENKRLLEELDSLRRRLALDRTRELEVTVKDLVSEKERLNALLRLKVEEIENLNREIMALKSEPVNVVTTFNVDLGREKEQVKSAGVHDNADLHRLASEINDKENEIARLRLAAGESENLRQALEALIREKNQLQELLNNNLRELETVRAKAELVEKLDRELKEAEKEKKKIEDEKEHLEKRIHELIEENEKLKIHLNQTLVELEEVRIKYSDLEKLRAQEIIELKEQFELLKKFNEEIKELQLKSAAERTAYETQIAQCQNAIADLEKQRDALLEDNERLAKQNVHKLEENEKMKKRIIESEEVVRLEMSELKSQIETYKASSYDVKQLTIKYSADRAADQTMIKQLEQLNENYKAEIQKLYELTEERKTDIEALTKTNEELRESQSKIVIRLKSEVEGDEIASKERFELLQKELEELEKAKNEYKNQAERNSIELTRRNKELVDKLQELDVLKLKYEEGLANYQALNTKLFARLSN